MKKNGKIKNPVLNMISSIISWTVFSLLTLIAVFLLYYVFSATMYASRGEKYEPPVSMYTIVSGSMLPNIKVYDVVINLKVDDPSTIKEKDIITFVSNSPISYGLTITHRVVGIKQENGEYYFKTKGDNNLRPDDTWVPYSNLIGKVFIKIPQLGRIQFLMLKAGGWLFLLLIPAMGIVVYDVLKVLKLNDTKDKVGDAASKTYDEKIGKEEEEKLKKNIKKRLFGKNKDKKIESLDSSNAIIELPKINDEIELPIVKKESNLPKAGEDDFGLEIELPKKNPEYQQEFIDEDIDLDMLPKSNDEK